MTLRVAVFAEDCLGMTLARDLGDRSVAEASLERGHSWVVELWQPPETRATQRSWTSIDGVEPWTTWETAKHLAHARGVMTHGLGLKGYGLEALRAARVAARFDPPPDLVVLCRDTDDRRAAPPDRWKARRPARRQACLRGAFSGRHHLRARRTLLEGDPARRPSAPRGRDGAPRVRRGRRGSRPEAPRHPDSAGLSQASRARGKGGFREKDDPCRAGAHPPRRRMNRTFKGGPPPERRTNRTVEGGTTPGPVRIERSRGVQPPRNARIESQGSFSGATSGRTRATRARG